MTSGPLYLESGGVTGVGLITLEDVGETEDEEGDTEEGEEQAPNRLEAGRIGREGGRGIEPGGLARRGKGKGGLDAPAAERAAEAAAAWR